MKKYLILYIILFTGIVSCKKEISNSGIQKEGQISFSVSKEILLNDSINGNNSSNGQKAKLQSSNIGATIVNHESIYSDDMSSEIFVEEIGVTNKNLKTSKNSNLSNSNSKSVIPVYQDQYNPELLYQLADGVKYRVLVYDQNNNFVEQVDGTAGTLSPKTTVLDKGKTYNWLAYSYSSSDILPSIPISEINDPKFAVENEDFLYASGTFDTPSGEGILDMDVPITFKHAMAMIEYQVNVTSFSGRADYKSFVNYELTDRPYIRADANQLARGTFNLKTATFSQISTIPTTVDAVARLNYATEGLFPAATYRGFFYTVPGGDNDYINSFKTTVTPWVILDRPAAPVKFLKTYDNKVRIGRGKFTRVNIYGLDAGIQISPETYFPNGDLWEVHRWTRGDLYVDQTQDFVFNMFVGSEGPLRVQHRNHETTSIFYNSTFQPYGVPTSSPTSVYGQSPVNYGSTYFKFRNPNPIGISWTGASAHPCYLLGPAPDSKPEYSALRGQWQETSVYFARKLVEFINDNANNNEFITHQGNSMTKSLILTLNLKGNGSNEWTERISFEMKGMAKYNESTGLYSMFNFHDPITNTDQEKPIVTANRQIGKAYYWLEVELGSPENIQPYENNFAYLELTINTDANPKYSAKIRQKTFNASDTPYLTPSDPMVTAKTGMNLRCVRAPNYYIVDKK